MMVNKDEGELTSLVQCMEVNLIPENQDSLRNVNLLKEEDVVAS
jgi:hypothetical protein